MKTVASNRRARFDYAITDTVEAGIILTGQEVKACRAGHVSLAGAYVSFHSGVPVLKSMKITKYSFASHLPDYDPGRDRELLLKKSESAKLSSAVAEKGVTLVPLEVKAGRFIKVVLGLGTGKKHFDKRQKIKEKDIQKRLRQGEEI